MKLYYTKGACSLIPRIIINEVNATVDFESVDLKTKKTETGKDFFAINPAGYVPALELDNGDVLIENLAIQIYLAEKFAAHHLLPLPTDFTRYRVLQWSTYMTTEIHKGFSPFFNRAFPQELKDSFFKPMMIKKFETVIDPKLAQTKYIVDDEFRLSDAYLFVMISWLHLHQFDISNWKNVTRYFALLKERPSIQKSLKDEGLA